MNEAAPKPGREPERTPDQYQAEGLISPEAVREDDTTQSLIAELHRAAELLSAAIRAADPDAMGQYPDQPWFEGRTTWTVRSEEHTSELQSRGHLVCRLLLEKKHSTTQK